MPETVPGRRPLTSRDTKWAKGIAAALARAGVRPNVISVASVVFAAGAGACLALTPRVAPIAAIGLFVGAAAGVQLRLLCNLFDGMVAIEGGFKTKTGDIFNELPDRFADAFVLIGCGYAAAAVDGALALGWAAAVLAVTTAYVRALGASLGAGQCFIGPMAKPQRMAAVTIASLLSAVLVVKGQAPKTMALALLIIVLGAVVTVIRRTRWLAQTLNARP